MPAKKPAPRYWLFKSEADCYPIQQLEKEPKQTTFWDGVRNYQARNMLRDDVQIGDGVLYYHSHADPLAIVGACRVVKAGYADHTAFEKLEQHYDPKSDPANPTWFQVDIQLDKIFDKPVARSTLQDLPDMAKMVLLQRGSRLSIQPVTAEEWKTVHKLAGAKPAC